MKINFSGCRKYVGALFTETGPKQAAQIVFCPLTAYALGTIHYCMITSKNSKF